MHLPSLVCSFLVARELWKFSTRNENPQTVKRLSDVRRLAISHTKILVWNSIESVNDLNRAILVQEPWNSKHKMHIHSHNITRSTHNKHWLLVRKIFNFFHVFHVYQRNNSQKRRKCSSSSSVIFIIRNLLSRAIDRCTRLFSIIFDCCRAMSHLESFKPHIPMCMQIMERHYVMFGKRRKWLTNIFYSIIDWFLKCTIFLVLLSKIVRFS